MNEMETDSQPGTKLPAAHFFRVIRTGPGLQQVISEPANLKELRDDIHALLEGLQPGMTERHANAIVITGTRNSEDILVTASFFVAQLANTWATAEGGPLHE